MWKIYATDGNGIAIESTVDDLTHSIIFAQDDVLSKIGFKNWGSEVFISNCMNNRPVKYVDYETETVSHPMEVWKYNRFFYKRKSFEYEQEYRFLINGEQILEYLRSKKLLKEQQMALGEIIDKNGFIHTGELISVDISKLINRVIICPSADKWFIDLVEKVLDKAGLSKVIVKTSELAKEPYEYK